jgi:pyruvate formate lyase activating enzyme
VAETLAWADALRRRTTVGWLSKPLADGWVECYACGHRCRIPPGKPGICRVRFNDAGTLRVPHGYVAGLASDPIEKKPFFHVLPGSRAFSFGMLGCDLHCSYCQNWETSQALRDPEAFAPPQPIEAEAIAEQALRIGASTVTSTYNEPLITAEWAIEVFKHARARRLKTAFVSNGNATPEVLAALRPWVDLYKVDLKSFRDRAYRQLGGRLDRILDTIPRLVQLGFWVEIVTLIVPGFNDTDEELTDIARFLVGISPDIPWHVTAFHTDYKMSDRADTPADTLLRAWDIGKREGLRYVYAGNRPGQVGPREHTFCPQCDRPVIERRGFQVLRMAMRDGTCAACGATIPGVWS